MDHYAVCRAKLLVFCAHGHIAERLKAVELHAFRALAYSCAGHVSAYVAAAYDYDISVKRSSLAGIDHISYFAFTGNLRQKAAGLKLLVNLHNTTPF
jgi:hypothetical protein